MNARSDHTAAPGQVGERLSASLQSSTHRFDSGPGLSSSVHPLLQTARGFVTDEDYTSAEQALASAVDRAKDIEAERDRFRAALTQIANAESGPWGRIAHNALHPERKAA